MKIFKVQVHVIKDGKPYDIVTVDIQTKNKTLAMIGAKDHTHKLYRDQQVFVKVGDVWEVESKVLYI